MKHSMRFAAIALSVSLVGCASTNNPRDPFEGFNRAMFTFNDKVDQVALKPAATVYRSVLPSFVQTGVGNFFGNLGDVWTAFNNVLQGKVGDGVSDLMRFTVNSTFGILGLLDISSEAGIPKHKEDFGQTLGRWGVGSGPYLVLPLLGSSTVRDTVALPLDIKGDLWSYKDPVNVRNIGTGVRLIDARAAVLDASDLIEGAALDRYEFVRDAYMQRRENKIHDGESPAPKEDSTAPGKNSDQDAAPAPAAAPAAAPAPAPAQKSELAPETGPTQQTGSLDTPATAQRIAASDSEQMSQPAGQADAYGDKTLSVRELDSLAVVTNESSIAAVTSGR